MLKEKLFRSISIVVTITLVEFGLISVGMDAAYRGYYPTIQNFSFLQAVVFPTVALILFLVMKNFKTVSVISMLVGTYCMVYLFFVYRIKMLVDPGMLLYSIGFIVVAGLQIWMLKRLRYST